MVVSVIRYLIFSLLVTLPANLLAQSDGNTTLHEALLSISKQHKLSLIFNPEYIENKKISAPSHSLSVHQQLSILLKGSDLEYKIENEQIFLFKEKTIFGYIEDSDTGERLIGASIYISQNGTHCISNEHGIFSFPTILDSINIEVSYIGYTSKSIALNVHKTERSQIIKMTSDNKLDEVEITDALVSNEDREYIELNKGSDIVLFQNQANSAIGGEPDIFQAMIRQTGINAGTEGIGGIHVRGGKNDQNMVILDGVKLYNPTHSFGVYSIVNSSIIDQARLHKAGSSGALTGSLSSIMDIKTMDPDLNQMHVSAQVTSIASQAMLSVPIVKGRFGIMATGRHTHINQILSALSDVSDEHDYTTENIKYKFSDIALKSYAKISNLSRIYFSLYRATDGYEDITRYDDSPDFLNPTIFSDDLDYSWQSNLANVRFNSIISKNTFLNIQASYYKYTYDNKVDYNYSGYEFDDEKTYEKYYTFFNSGVRNINFKLDFQTIKKQHHLQYGISANFKEFKVGKLFSEDTDYDNTMPIPTNLPILESTAGRYLSREFIIHFSDKIKHSSKWMSDIGFYFTYVDSKDVEYENILDPNTLFHGYLLTKYTLSNKYSIGFSLNRNIQTDHLLTTSDNGYPNDIWVPSTAFTPPAISNQLEVFTTKKIKNHTFRIGGYYKKQDGLIFYDSTATLPTLTDFISSTWEFDTELGNAEGWGLEFDYTYHKPKHYSIKAAYTYGEMNYQFDQVNNGNPFPYDFSIPHTLAIGATIHLHKKWLLNLDWYFSSGKPYTLYESDDIYSPLERDKEGNLIALSGYNDLLAPSVHKLSVSLATNWFWGKLRNDLFVGIQNVYDKRNEIYRYNYIDFAEDRTEVRVQNGFPLLPMLRWRVSI